MDMNWLNEYAVSPQASRHPLPIFIVLEDDHQVKCSHFLLLNEGKVAEGLDFTCTRITHLGGITCFYVQLPLM